MKMMPGTAPDLRLMRARPSDVWRIDFHKNQFRMVPDVYDVEGAPLGSRAGTIPACIAAKISEYLA